MAKLVPLPTAKVHSGLRVINPTMQPGRIIEHRKIAYSLVRTAIGIAINRRVAFPLMNMAGDIFVTLAEITVSKDMTRSYRRAAEVCYDKALAIRCSTSMKPYKDYPVFVDGLRLAL